MKELAAAREHLADFGERGRRELKHKRAAADLRRKMLAIADLPSPERDAREEDVDREFELLDAAAGDLERRLRDEADELDKAEAGLVAGPVRVRPDDFGSPAKRRERRRERLANEKAVRAQESGWVATGSKWETHNLLIRKAMNRVPDGDEPPKEKTEAPKDKEDVMCTQHPSRKISRSRVAPRARRSSSAGRSPRASPPPARRPRTCCRADSRRRSARRRPRPRQPPAAAPSSAQGLATATQAAVRDRPIVRSGAARHARPGKANFN